MSLTNFTHIAMRITLQAMQSNRPRRWLSLIVHPRDVVGPSDKRLAIREAIASGALDLLQLRSMESDSVEDVEAAGKFLAGCARDNTTFVVNHSSFDVAARVEARGWHLKERFFAGFPHEDVVRAVQTAHKQHFLVGCSVHTVDVALQAAALRVDYLQVGTMFSTPSHPEKSSDQHLEGPELLHAIRSTSQQRNRDLELPPLIAVGGINTEDHVRRVVAAGADGVAVIRGILAASDPHAAALEYRAWLDHHP